MHKTNKRYTNNRTRKYTRKQSGGFRYGNIHTGDILLFEQKNRSKSKSRSKGKSHKKWF